MHKISRHQPLKRGFVNRGIHLFHFQTSFGEGAGFVQTHHIAMGKVFQRMQIPHQHIFLGQADHPHCQTDADEQHQPLGEHSQQPRRCRHHRGIHRRAADKERLHKQQRPQRHDKKAGEFGDLFHGRQQLGTGALRLFDLIHHLGGKTLVHTAFRLCEAASRDHAAAGKQLVARQLDHRLGFAGQDGFVDLQPSLLQYTIGADGAAAGQHQHISRANLLRTDGGFLPAAENRDHRLRQQS